MAAAVAPPRAGLMGIHSTDGAASVTSAAGTTVSSDAGSSPAKKLPRQAGARKPPAPPVLPNSAAFRRISLRTAIQRLCQLEDDMSIADLSLREMLLYTQVVRARCRVAAAAHCDAAYHAQLHKEMQVSLQSLHADLATVQTNLENARSESIQAVAVIQSPLALLQKNLRAAEQQLAAARKELESPDPELPGAAVSIYDSRQQLVESIERKLSQHAQEVAQLMEHIRAQQESSVASIRNKRQELSDLGRARRVMARELDQLCGSLPYRAKLMDDAKAAVQASIDEIEGKVTAQRAHWDEMLATQVSIVRNQVHEELAAAFLKKLERLRASYETKSKEMEVAQHKQCEVEMDRLGKQFEKEFQQCLVEAEAGRARLAHYAESLVRQLESVATQLEAVQQVRPAERKVGANGAELSLSDMRLAVRNAWSVRRVPAPQQLKLLSKSLQSVKWDPTLASIFQRKIAQLTAQQRIKQMEKKYQHMQHLHEQVQRIVQTGKVPSSSSAREALREAGFVIPAQPAVLSPARVAAGGGGAADFSLLTHQMHDLSAQITQLKRELFDAYASYQEAQSRYFANQSTTPTFSETILQQELEGGLAVQLGLSSFPGSLELDSPPASPADSLPGSPTHDTLSIGTTPLVPALQLDDLSVLGSTMGDPIMPVDSVTPAFLRTTTSGISNSSSPSPRRKAEDIIKRSRARKNRFGL